MPNSSPQEFNALIDKATTNKTTLYRKSKSLCDLPRCDFNCMEQCAPTDPQKPTTTKKALNIKAPQVVNPRDAFATLREVRMPTPCFLALFVTYLMPSAVFASRSFSSWLCH